MQFTVCSAKFCHRFIIILLFVEMNCCVVGFVVVCCGCFSFSEGVGVEGGKGKIVTRFFRTFAKVEIYQFAVSFVWFQFVRIEIDLNIFRYS